MSNTLKGNYIGTDVSGDMALPNSVGIVIGDGAQQNVIGGATAAERNTISGNASHGIQVTDSNTVSNTITQNSIYSNTGLGIDLDAGGNRQLQSPLIMSATLSAGIVVSGTVCPSWYRGDFHRLRG